MSTTTAITDQYPTSSAVPDDFTASGSTAVEHLAPAEARFARHSLAMLRIATGVVFLWAFLDKAIGLGYTTTTERSWLSGGSPTNGSLSNVVVGPFQSLLRSWAGAEWADIAFMAGLGAVGLAVVLGVGLRISAVAGSVMMLLMWIAEWPPARIDSLGAVTGSSNPVIGYHLIYALALIVVAATAAGHTVGLGARWAALPIVRSVPWLR